MSDDSNKLKVDNSDAEAFFAQSWGLFIIEVDRMTGGGPVARQMFIDAREKHLKAVDQL